MSQLSGMDASFVHLDHDRNLFQIGVLLTYDISTAKDGFVRFKDILETFDRCIKPDSVFRKKLHRVPFNLDNPYWVDDEQFDMEHHVRHIALPKPGDWRQLCILVARIHARPMDMGKPLWEAYVIEGLDNVEGIPKGGFAVYIKLHHAAADGTSTNELIGSIHDLIPFPKSDPLAADQPKSNKDNRAPSNIKMLSRAYINAIKQPKRLFNLGQALLPALKGARKNKATKEDNHSVSTRFNGRVSGNIVFGATSFDFKDIREIKKTVDGATINDVILALVSGAMQKYLAAKDETPDEDLMVGMPINIRPIVGDLQESEDTGNLVSVSRISLYNTMANPLDRLKAINKSANDSKAYQNAVGAKLILEVSRVMPAYFLSVAGRAIPSMMGAGDDPLVGTIVTNVPGSQEPMYMTGARLAGITGIGIVLEGIGLFHAVTSYCGTVTVSFQACRVMMPDPDTYHDCIIESFNDLLAAANKKQAQAAKKRARAKATKAAKTAKAK